MAELLRGAQDRVWHDLKQWLAAFDRDRLIVVLLVLLVVALWGWWRASSRTSRASRRRNRRARKAESQAERLLEAEGYSILDRQLTQRWELEIDGEAREVFCRADLLVERGPDLYIADVKSGAVAPDPRQPATRRQLLEYLLAFDVDGALVVDMQRQRVLTVAFPGLSLSRLDP